jgi:hypothetical protein
MIRWLWIAGAMSLVGCAGSAYRYDDDGYWWAPPRAPTLIISAGWGGCSGWSGAFGYPYYGYGYGYGAHWGYGWSPCGYGHGYGYGYGPGRWYGAGIGYWRDPYWSQPWYLPPRTIGPPPAGARARHLASDPDEDLTVYPRYEDLAPSRRRDLGGGDRSWSSGGGAYAPVPAPAPRGGIGSAMQGGAGARYPAPPQGLGAGHLGASPGISVSPRQSFDAGTGRSPRSGESSASPRSNSARSLTRESREED